jgi:hypothetical protein
LLRETALECSTSPERETEPRSTRAVRTGTIQKEEKEKKKKKE